MYSSQAAVSCSVCLRTHRAYLSLPRAQAFANTSIKKKQWFAVCFLGRGCAWGCCVHGLIMLPPQQWNQSHGCDDGSVVNMQSVFNQPSACIISRGVYFSGRAGAARRLARHLWPQLCTHSCVLASWTSLRPGIHLREST